MPRCKTLYLASCFVDDGNRVGIKFPAQSFRHPSQCWTRFVVPTMNWRGQRRSAKPGGRKDRSQIGTLRLRGRVGLRAKGRKARPTGATPERPGATAIRNYTHVLVSLL